MCAKCHCISDSIQFNSIPLLYLIVGYVNNSMCHTYEYSELFNIPYS